MKVNHNNIGSLMSYFTWVASVKSGCLINYDGFGHWANKEVYEDSITVYPSQFTQGALLKPEWATHIVWYNR